MSTNDEITRTVAQFVSEAFAEIEREVDGFVRITLKVEYDLSPHEPVREPVALVYEAAWQSDEMQYVRRTREERLA